MLPVGMSTNACTGRVHRCQYWEGPQVPVLGGSTQKVVVWETTDKENMFVVTIMLMSRVA